MTDAEYHDRERKLNEELDTLEKVWAEEILAERFLKNFGCINFEGEEFFHELWLARLFHERHMRRHPEMHAPREYEKYHCYHVTECKCGFQEAYDSGD